MNLVKVVFSSRMAVTFLMGFSCGLPLLLTISVLQAWMKEEGVDLSVIGLMSLVGIPYTVKFLWAPVLDRMTPPFLGRRRGWLFIAQLSLMAAIAGLGLSNPKSHPFLLAGAAFLVTFFSASQDIVVDAYRREALSDAELGLGSSLYVNGYRVGMLLASGGGLILADHLPFSMVYLIMAAYMIPGMATTLYSKEPEQPFGVPGTLAEAVFAPLREYFTRNGAWWILAFILCYKIGDSMASDSMASAMATPFYLDIGFSKTEIGAVVKLFGFWATIAGSLVGGIWMIRIGIGSSLWLFGILQAVSTAGFMVLTYTGPSVPVLSAVIAFENFTSGMGTSAFTAFMASMTHKRFTATQYALLSSLMGVPRVLVSAPTGFLAKAMGWNWFFATCVLAAIPGLLILLRFSGWNTAGVQGEVH
ncbi:MAG: AmpG family muropeptide MFS transporter [Deltaproteobacteria bacterium]|nr:AmpG family muropeptide MFS transporter [Deltaproteobacteria bacterium]